MCAAVLLAAAASASDDLKSRWENGGRAETLDWFRREMFGYAPERPSDQKFEKDAVSFAGGEIKIRVNKVLREDGAISPELQSAMNELDWDAVNADSADVTKRKVEAVQNLLNR